MEVHDAWNDFKGAHFSGNEGDGDDDDRPGGEDPGPRGDRPRPRDDRPGDDDRGPGPSPDDPGVPPGGPSTGTSCGSFGVPPQPINLYEIPTTAHTSSHIANTGTQSSGPYQPLFPDEPDRPLPHFAGGPYVPSVLPDAPFRPLPHFAGGS